MNKFLLYVNSILESLDIYMISNTKKLESQTQKKSTKNLLEEK